MAALNSFDYICTRGRQTFLSFAHCCSASAVIPLLPMATFTPSIRPNHGLPRTDLRLLPPSIPLWPYRTHQLSPRAQTISILSDQLYSQTISIPALLRASSFLLYPFTTLQPNFSKHFISWIFTFLLSALLISHAFAPYNAVGTITPSYRYFLAFIPYPQLLSILSRAPHALYPSFILRTKSLSHPPTAATCDYRYLKQSTSSNGSSFNITFILPPFPYPDHLIILPLPMFTLN